MSEKATEDKVWFLFEVSEPAALETCLESPDPATAISDLYVLGQMKQIRRQAAPLKPERPGELVFNANKGTVALHDGRGIQSGRPSYKCPDCDGHVELTKKFFNYGRRSVKWFYVCENRDSGCGAMTEARVNGAMMAPPADADTRRARALTTKQFDRLWKEAPELRGLAKGSTRKAAEAKARGRAYRWLAGAMLEMGVNTKNIPQMSIPELRIAYRICRDASPEEVAGIKD